MAEKSGKTDEWCWLACRTSFFYQPLLSILSSIPISKLINLKWKCQKCSSNLSSNIHAGSRRPSLASVHSTSSSIRSYGHMRFEKELQQKELRQEMKLRLTRLQQQQHYLQNKPHIIISDLQSSGAIPKTIAITTPSPITPNSTDELLPSVAEGHEVKSFFCI